MESTKTILGCTLLAVVYGIVHDQVTVRICLEYFTIGHPPIFRTESPTLLALGWGVIATWWVGAALGGALSLCSRLGPYPKLDARDLRRGVVWLFVAGAVTAPLAGWLGNVAASKGYVFLIEPFASDVPPEKHVAFITDLWAHGASYGVGLIGGTILCALTVQRRRLRKERLEKELRGKERQEAELREQRSPATELRENESG